MSKVMLYDSNNIDALIWPDTPDGDYAKRYLLPMIQQGTSAFIANVVTQLYVLQIDDLVLPVTVNQAEYRNAYVCSPYTHYVSYAIEELRELKSPVMETMLKVPLTLMGILLRLGKINNVVVINNWMLSTNLYPDISETQLKLITAALRERFSGYVLMFRSLNELTNPEIMDALKTLGYWGVASRRSYISETKMPLKSRAKSIVLKDQKLLSEKMRWSTGLPLNALDRQRVLELYNQLYLEKYSKLNPQFTMQFVEAMLDEGILECHVLWIDDVIQGVVGFFIRNGVMTTPFFGYDLSMPRALGLYRLLSSKLLSEASQRQLILHQSSGAGEFKKSRGAVPVIEYSMIRLPKGVSSSLFSWFVLKKMANDIAMPILIKRGL